MWKGERVTDTEEVAKKRLEVYHKGVPAFEVLSKEWFEYTPIIRVNAEQDLQPVLNDIESTITNFLVPPTISYFPFPPFKAYNTLLKAFVSEINSTRFHFHIDTENHDILKKIIYVLTAYYYKAQGQVKVTSISDLCLGQQVYDNMMNFHEITDSNLEAFATGRLGDYFDIEFIQAILYVVNQMGYKVMVEVEQYIGEWLMDSNKGDIITESLYEPKEVDMSALIDYEEMKLKNSKMELHLGFNVPKGKYMERPIELKDLVNKCSEAGFDNGGWFIFKSIEQWCYRSNEFSELSIEECKMKLVEQATKLGMILKGYGLDDVDVMFSLEIVHCIYQF